MGSQIVFGFVLLFAAMFGVSLGIWISDRDPPAIVLAREVMTPTVEPGGSLRVKYHVRRTRSCAAHADRFLYDSQNTRYALTDYDVVKSPIGDEEFTISVPVPNTFAEGIGFYRIYPSYTCNVIHRWFWPISGDLPDVPFTVRRSDGTP